MASLTTPQELDAISAELTRVYREAYDEIEENLVMVGRGFANASPWRLAFWRQGQAQLIGLLRAEIGYRSGLCSRAFSLLDERTAQWANANIPALYGNGMAVVDELLTPGGLSVAAHPGQVTPMMLGMTRIHSEAIETAVRAFVTGMNYRNGLCARDVEDLFRQAQLSATARSFARLETSTVNSRRLKDEIQIRAAAMRERIQELRGQGRASDAIMQALQDEGYVSDRMIQGLRRRGLRTATQLADHLSDQVPLAFVDKLGRRWDMADYASMAASTTARDAAMAGTDNRMVEFGLDLVRVVDHYGECPRCRPWEGRILSLTGETKGFPTKAAARTKGLFHPRCIHLCEPIVDEDELAALTGQRAIA